MKPFILFCFLSFLIATFAVHAQVTKITGVNMGDISTQLNSSGAFVKETTKYKGSPYFSNNWVKGFLILNNNTRSKNIVFRYNMRYDRIEFIKNGKLYSISDKKLNGFNIKTTGPYITFRNGFKTNVDDINTNTLLHVIVNGEVKFLAHHTVEVQRNIPTYNAAATINKFVDDVDYYLVTSDDVFHEIAPNPGDIYRVLPGKNEILRKYMARINLSSVNDVKKAKKIVQVYNMLHKKKEQGNNK